MPKFAEPHGCPTQRKPGAGHHGFPNSVKDMHAVFLAWGPAFRKGTTVPTFENIHVYPMVACILGLKTPANIDGDKKVLAGILK